MKKITVEGYLGPEQQIKFLWQLVTEPEFAGNVFPFLKADYFDSDSYKRFFIILKEFHNEFGKVPNLQNKSINLAINKYCNPNDPTDRETANAVLERINLWNQRVQNKELDFDGDIIQKEIYAFIKQGEYVNMANFIINKVKTDGFNDNDTLNHVEKMVKKITEIGVDENEGTDAFDDVDDVLTKDFRNPIATGIPELDNVMGGGLGRGEIGVVLAPTGVGKSTILSLFANHAHAQDKNVLQVVFEDTEKQIKRKHYAIWSGVPLNQLELQEEEVRIRVAERKKAYPDSHLHILRLSQEDTTMPKIRAWIDRYYKKHGIKYDMIVLDYLDCVESHKNSKDELNNELAVIKSFEAMAAELDIPCWTAIQSNRSGINAEVVDHGNMQGSIKKAQKTHFMMSVAKTPEQKEEGLANISVLKARFAQDGQRWDDVIFDNNKVMVRIPVGSAKKKSKAPIKTERDVQEDHYQLVKSGTTAFVNIDSEVNVQTELLDQSPAIPTIDSSEAKSRVVDNNNNHTDLLSQLREGQSIMKKE
jgi:replicative DNA helicase